MDKIPNSKKNIQKRRVKVSIIQLVYFLYLKAYANIPTEIMPKTSPV